MEPFFCKHENSLHFACFWTQLTSSHSLEVDWMKIFLLCLVDMDQQELSNGIGYSYQFFLQDWLQLGPLSAVCHIRCIFQPCETTNMSRPSMFPFIHMQINIYRKMPVKTSIVSKKRVWIGLKCLTCTGILSHRSVSLGLLHERLWICDTCTKMYKMWVYNNVFNSPTMLLICIGWSFGVPSLKSQHLVKTIIDSIWCPLV